MSNTPAQIQATNQERYDAYAEACRYLASDGTTVPGRKSALAVRDAYEADLRLGALKHPAVVPFSEASIRQTGEMLRQVAVLTAHRACHSAEHNPEAGRIHGYCIVCGVPWPCDYAGQPWAK